MERDRDREPLLNTPEPRRDEEPSRPRDSARALLTQLATVRRIASEPTHYLPLEEGPEGTLFADDLISPAQKEEMRKADVEARLTLHGVLIQDQARMLAAIEGFRSYALSKKKDTEPKAIASALLEVTSFALPFLTSYAPVLKLRNLGEKIAQAILPKKIFDLDTTAQEMVTSFTRVFTRAIDNAIELPREIRALAHRAWLDAAEGKRADAVRNTLQEAGIVPGDFEALRLDLERELDRQIDVWKCRNGETADLVGCATDTRLNPPRTMSPSDLAYGPIKK